MESFSKSQWLKHYERERPDNWTRENEIGAGTFGKVYLERNTRTGKLRAIKTIQRRSPEQDLVSELLAFTRLSRPQNDEYFVNFQGWYEEDFGVSLAMEYMELGDLRAHMKNGRFLEHEAADIAFQVFTGLYEMHKDGFTHRDLKPENIFVVAKAPLWHVKIGDFGVSKRVDNDNTFLKTEVGTLPYMAPELICRSKSPIYDNSVDVWAAGLILFEMLSGENPFASLSFLIQYYYKQVELPESMLRTHEVTDDGCGVLRTLLAPQPEDRPASGDMLKSKWFSKGTERSPKSSSSNYKSIDAANRYQSEHEHNFSSSSNLPRNMHGAREMPGPKDRSSPESMEVLQLNENLVDGFEQYLAGEPWFLNSHSIQEPWVHSETSKDDFNEIQHYEDEDVSNNPPIMKAVMLAAGRPAAAKSRIEYLIDNGANVNVYAPPFGTALLIASREGYRDIVQILIDWGADIKAGVSPYGNALQTAAYYGHKEVVQILLNARADIHTQGRGGIYGDALHVASYCGRKEIVQLLLDAGADINNPNGGHGTALHEASFVGEIEVVQLLLGAGADINIAHEAYGTALQLASSIGQKKVVQLLLDAGADVNSTDGGYGSYGSALQAASSEGNIEVVQLLLDAGAHVNANNRRTTALRRAQIGGHEDVVKLLREHGAR